MRPPKYPVLEGKKKCSKCGVCKPHTLSFFKNSHSKPGSICKECTGPRDAENALMRWRAQVAVSGLGAWAKEQREYYYSPTGQRSYRNTHLKKMFGITLNQYESLLLAQSGVCALCGTSDPKGRGAFHVDHDHVTGVIRGLLCHACNTGLGKLGDDPLRVSRAIQYLEGTPLEYPVAPSSAPVLHRKYKGSELRKKYGIQLDVYEACLVRQHGVCAICCTAPGGGSLHVDHDHVTGAFRGLLCSSCNLGIGSLKDDLGLLKAAVSYLRMVGSTASMRVPLNVETNPNRTEFSTKSAQTQNRMVIYAKQDSA